MLHVPVVPGHRGACAKTNATHRREVSRSATRILQLRAAAHVAEEQLVRLERAGFGATPMAPSGAWRTMSRTIVTPEEHLLRVAVRAQVGEPAR